MAGAARYDHGMASKLMVDNGLGCDMMESNIGNDRRDERQPRYVTVHL